MKSILCLFVFACSFAVAQQHHTASFVAKLGNDTVIVETYNMNHNHLYGKAFLRYPEDQIGVFDFHFFPDGSIRHYSIAFMNPDSNFVGRSVAGAYCDSDSCTWYGVWEGATEEYSRKHSTKRLDFIGGWTPTISLIEWHCMRLLKSNQKSLPLVLLNDYIGLRNVAVYKGEKDTILFGGAFLEYTKLTTTKEGRILTYDGTGTPWNYIVTRHVPLDVDQYARRLSKTPKLGNPSPTENAEFISKKDTIRLSYGRPSKRGRQIFGAVVPYDSIWRAGAGDPTKIDLPYDIRFGKTQIPKGSYSLYTVPGRNAWQLIFNADLRQWPTDPNRSADVAVVPMKVRSVASVAERFSIDIKPSAPGGIITMTWDGTEAFVEFRVEN